MNIQLVQSHDEIAESHVEMIKTKNYSNNLAAKVFSDKHATNDGNNFT